MNFPSVVSLENDVSPGHKVNLTGKNGEECLAINKTK